MIKDIYLCVNKDKIKECKTCDYYGRNTNLDYDTKKCYLSDFILNEQWNEIMKRGREC